MKKRLLLALLALVSVQFSYAQFTVLFVDDDGLGYNNAETFAASLEALAVDFTYFDAVTNGYGPTAGEMAMYDLVIWHTASDADGMYFWNAVDADNPEIAAYLDGGGDLWVVGTDILYDRYGEAPVSFVEGDFVYDYLGLESYDFQTYSDDGLIGLAAALPDMDQPIADLPSLTWYFSTLWFVDGVTPKEGVEPIYRMGYEDYEFADSICGVWYDSGNFRVLSFFFDLSLAVDQNLITSTTEAVLAFFQEPSSIANLPIQGEFRVFPNPSKGDVVAQFELEQTVQCTATVLDAQGRQIATLCTDQTLPAGEQQLEWQADASVANGLYWLKIELDGAVRTERITLLR
ncbi:MAG: T9SS type A sorting domain-containing protein [Phaeodactylibacter sp.]|nr:T9SS type A sorting domain-containing protein [Phaeodactylibacter sp.]